MKSMRITLLVWFVGIITLALAGLGAFNYQQRQGEMLENLAQQRQAVLKRAGLTLPDALYGFDDRQVENFLAAEMNNRDIATVVVLDASGGLSYAQGRDAEGKAAVRSPDRRKRHPSI